MYRIIIADDEPIMHKALMALVDWKSMDCEIVGACFDGQAVIDRLNSEMPDIVISDIKMPRKNGIDLARHISENGLPVKVILLTAYADFSYAQQAIRHGVTEYVIKTGAVTGIVEAVKRCIDQMARAEAAMESPGERAASFLKSVLDGSLHDQHRIAEKAAICKVAFSRAVLLRIDIRTPENAPEESTAADGLEELFQTVFSEAALHFISLGRANCSLLICDAFGDVQARCGQVANTYATLTGRRIYIGLSEPLHGLPALPAASGQAERALAQRFFDADKLVYRHEARPVDPKKTAAIRALAKRLEAAVSVGNGALARELTTRLLDLQKDASSAKQLKTEALLVMKRLEDAVRPYSERIDEIGSELDYQAATESFCFFDEYAAYLRRFVADCCRLVAESLQQGGNLVTSAGRYIEEHYRQQLSLAEIAAAVGANPSYLSRLYKEKTGVTITDAINRRKIAHAMAMLDAGGMKIYEIAAQVGMEDTTYFSHLFRKYTGVSPRTYQESRRTAQQKQEDIENWIEG